MIVGSILFCATTLLFILVWCIFGNLLASRFTLKLRQDAAPVKIFPDGGHIDVTLGLMVYEVLKNPCRSCVIHSDARPEEESWLLVK